MKRFLLSEKSMAWLFFFLVSSSFLLQVSSSSKDCNPKFTPSPEKDRPFLSQRFDILKDKTYKTSSKKDNTNYFVGICNPPAKDAKDPKAAVLMKKPEDTEYTVLGRLSSLNVHGNGKWLTIIFEDGDSFQDCDNKTGTWKAKIVAFCGSQDGEAKLELKTEKEFVFTLAEPALCQKSAVESSSSVSASSAIGNFISIAVLILIAYFTCGFLYKRFIVGAQGMEQLPNYLFWIRIGRFLKDKVRRDGVRRQREDFQYTSPPLTEPSEDTVAILGADQYQAVPNSSPPRHREPDADERLLQV